MKCEIRKVGNVTLFSLHGDVIFGHLAQIRETFKSEVAQSSTGKFLLDLGGAERIDSAGVGFVVSIYQTIVARKGAFAIICPDGAVKSVLQTVGLSRLFNIYESEDEAIKAL